MPFHLAEAHGDVFEEIIPGLDEKLYLDYYSEAIAVRERGLAVHVGGLDVLPPAWFVLHGCMLV